MDPSASASHLSILTDDIGMGDSVQVIHTPKHARQRCDVTYGKPNLLDVFVPPVVSKVYNPLSLRELSASLIVANTSPLSLRG